jgi:hypothetical protein
MSMASLDFQNRVGTAEFLAADVLRDVVDGRGELAPFGEPLVKALAKTSTSLVGRSIPV